MLKIARSARVSNPEGSVRMSKLSVCLLIGIFVSGFAAAAPDDVDLSNQSDDSDNTLQNIAHQLEIPGLSDEQLRDLRIVAEKLRSAASESVAENTPDLEAAEAELEALGLPPGEGETPDPVAITTQREEINARLKEIEGRIKQAELIDSRAARIVGEIAEIRRTRFAERLFARGPSPFTIGVWREALPQFVAASAAVRQALTNVIRGDPLKTQVRDSALAIGIAALIAIVFAWPLHAWLLRRFGRNPAVQSPGFMEAARAMIVVGAVRALLPTAAAALIYSVAVNTAALPASAKEIGHALFLGFVFFAWVAAFFRASLSPKHPGWRVVPVPDNFARGVWRFVILLALVYAIDIVLSEVFSLYGARLEITVVCDYLIALLVLLLISAVLLRSDMWQPAEPASAKPRWRAIRTIATIALLAFPLAGALGYVALMRFVATQVMLTGGLIFLLLILHRLGREFLTQIGTGDNWIANWLRVSLHFDDDTALRFVFWLSLIYDVSLTLGGAALALFVWGANSEDLGIWLHKAVFGFQIGKINIALIDIAVALLLVAVLLGITRIVQRMLAEQILPQTRLDIGIRESIRQGTGYIGIVIASMAGIVALGLDLSNFALIASALTVGIGFGLQNVVNNFVSGLILLIERPVKVGDWIVVGDKQGYVKHIRVRATEIQTFDRASVFVPNSELISGMVTNWTHADRMGRVIVPVGVAYGSDTNKVREILLQIGNAHPQVIAEPPASALFRGFGDSSLDFELRCFLEDVEKIVSVTSDLCFAIDQAFRDANIEIPFPQQDVYIRKLADGVAAQSHGPGAARA
jgi:small-conductance mechanosensitive channel